MHKKRWLIGMLALLLVLAPGCQRLNYQKKFSLKPLEVQPIEYGAPAYSQKVTVAIKPASGGVSAEQLAHARQDEMTNDFGAGRSAGLAGDDGAETCIVKALSENPDLCGFAGTLTALKGDKPAARRSGFCSGFAHQSFSTPVRTAPMTSSIAPSRARCMVVPVPTASAA